MRAMRKSVPIEGVKNDRDGHPLKDGEGPSGSGSGDPLAPPSKKIKKPKPPQDGSKIFTGTFTDGRIVFGPCNLTRNVYGDGGEVTSTEFVQDWVVVETTRGSDKFFELQDRSGNAYPVYDETQWALKTQAVRDAMIARYVEYNFKYYLDKFDDPDDSDALPADQRDAAVLFCKEEANRLLPPFQYIQDDRNPSKRLPVIAHGRTTPKERMKIFNRLSDQDLRKKAYSWEQSPLLVNDLQNAEARFDEMWRKKDPNLAFPDSDDMFPAAEVAAITAAMNRNPSWLTGGEDYGYGYLQGWRYSSAKNAIVARDGPDDVTPTDERREGWERSHDDVHEKMLEAYVEKWFPPESESVGEKTFQEWRAERGLANPMEEAARVIPKFSKKWGYQLIPSSFKLFPSEGEKPLKEMYSLQAPGVGELLKRYKMLSATTKVAVNGKIESIPLNIPIDILWTSEDPQTKYEEYRKAARAPYKKTKPAKVSKERKPRKDKKPPKAKKEPMDVMKGVPPESYLRMRLEVLVDRRARESEHRKAVATAKKTYKGEELEKEMAALLEKYNKENREAIEREEAELEAKWKSKKSNEVDVKLLEENEALAQLTDEEKVFLLRSGYYLELRSFKQARLKAAELAKKKEEASEPVSVPSDPMDLDPATDTIPLAPGEQGESPDVSVSDVDPKYSNEEREEIHFVYLDRLRAVLKDSEDMKTLYEKEFKMVAGRRKEAALEQFQRESMLDPEQRRTNRAARRNAAAEKSAAAKEPKVPYADRSFEERMNHDKSQRTRISTIYQNSEKAAAKLETFTKYATMLKDDLLANSTEAKAKREEVYKAMYEELNEKVKGKKNKTAFTRLMDIVLQQTLKLEWKAYLEQMRLKNMTEEEKAAEQELVKQKERRKIYDDHVAKGEIEEAINILDKDLQDEIRKLTDDKLEQQRYIIDQYKAELDEASENGETFALFDKLDFADRVIGDLVEIEADTTIEIRRNATRNVLLKAHLRNSPDDIVEKDKQSVLDLGTPASKNVRTVLQLQGVAKIVDANTIVLLRNQEERQEKEAGIRAERTKALEDMYDKLLKEADCVDTKSLSAQDQENLKTAAMRGVDVKEDIKKIESFNEELAESKEKADYYANIAVKRDRVVLAFQRFLESVRDYRSVNESATLAPFFNGERGAEQKLKKQPDPLVDGVPGVDAMASAILEGSFAKMITPLAGKKEKKKLEIGDYIEMAYEWRRDQAEKIWYAKKTLDPFDPEDRKDLEFYNNDAVEYDDGVDYTDITQEAKANLDNLHKSLAPGKPFNVWLTEIKKEFENEQRANATVGMPELKMSFEHLADFVVVKKIGHYKGSRKAILGNMMQGKRAKAATTYELTGFQGKHKSAHQSSRLETFMKSNEAGEWYVPYYNEDGQEVEKNEECAASKITDVLHFVLDDLEGVPDNMRPPEKYAWKNRGRYEGEIVNRVSYFKPWDGMDSTEADGIQQAWDMATAALTLSRTGFKISDMEETAKEGEDATTIRKKLKSWLEYDFFTLLDTEDYIVNVKFPDRFEKRPGDSPEQKVAKQEAYEQWREFRLFLEQHYKGSGDDEDTSVISTKAGDAGGDDYEEDTDDSDDDEEEDDDDDDEEEDDDEEDDEIEKVEPRKATDFGEFSEGEESGEEEEYWSSTQPSGRGCSQRRAKSNLGNVPEGESDEEDDDFEAGEDDDDDDDDDDDEDDDDDDDDDDDESDGKEYDDSDSEGGEPMDEDAAGGAPSVIDRVSPISETQEATERNDPQDDPREWWGYQSTWWKR